MIKEKKYIINILTTHPLVNPTFNIKTQNNFNQSLSTERTKKKIIKCCHNPFHQLIIRVYFYTNTTSIYYNKGKKKVKYEICLNTINSECHQYFNFNMFFLYLLITAKSEKCQKMNNK